MDAKRLQVLRGTRLLDSPAEVAFDRLTRLVAGLLDAPVALVSLVDEERQFFKSSHGLPEPWASRRETPLTHSFCLHATRSGEPLVVTDARKDPLLHQNLAISELSVIAYAGIPLIVAGAAIGAFCVIDDRPRAWSEKDLRLLHDLAASVVSEIELRVAVRSASEQRALTSALLESLGDGVLAIDTNRNVLVANSVVRQWFEGAEAGAPLPASGSAMQWATLADGSPLAPEDAVLGRGLRGDPADGVTFRLQDPGAAARLWIEASGRPVRDVEGKVVAAVGVFRDITERVRQGEQNSTLQAQLAVREREQSLAAVLDSIEDAVIVADREGLVRRMNPVAEALTGWSLSEAVGRPLDEVFVVVIGPSGADSSRLRSRSGAERPIARRASPIVAPGSTATGTVVVFRDMTAERAAEASVAASELKYRDLFENAPDLYLTAELPSELIVDCNQTLCDRLGYEKNEIIGRPFYSVYHADYLATKATRQAQFQKAGEFVDVERRLRRKDGSSLEVSLTLRGIRDAQGNVVRAMAVWRDISRRKQAERDRAFLIEVGDVLRTSTVVSEVLAAVSTALGEYLLVSRCVFVEIDMPNDRLHLYPGFVSGVPPLLGDVPLSPFGKEIAAESAAGKTVVLADTAADSRTAALFDVAFGPASVRSAISASQLRDGAWAASLVVAFHHPRLWEEREVAMVSLVGERVWLWVEHLRILAKLRDRDVAEAIRRSEERFQALVEGVKDYAIFMLNPQGKVETWHAGAERMNGYSAAEIIGDPYEVFFTAADRDRDHPRNILQQARRTGRVEEEGWRVRKDGSQFWANVTLTTLYGRDGLVEGFAKVSRDVTERRRQDDELDLKQRALVQSLKEREVLLQEVHHRVKNNLQVISSIINMQGRKLEPGARAALDECQMRVLTIALIHEKLYQSKDYSRVRFAEYVRSLASNVFQATGTSPGDVSLELAIDDVALGVDRAIPCGLLINELITNSLKHAFKQRRGTVRVELKELDRNLLQLVVADDGLGLPADFDIQKAETMGLQIVVTLAEQLEATLAVTSDRGASFTITFAGDS